MAYITVGWQWDCADPDCPAKTKPGVPRAGIRHPGKRGPGVVRAARGHTDRTGHATYIERRQLRRVEAHA